MTDEQEAKNTIYHCPSCGKDIKDVHNARQNMVQCPYCGHVDDLEYFFRSELMTDEQKIKNKIEAFFNDLNEQHKVTVTHVCLNWIEHFENGKHDKYFLSNFDVDIKL